MFTFTLKDFTKEDVQFTAVFTYPTKKRKQKNRRKVKCEIYMNTNGKEILVSTGYSTKCDTDHYCRYEGRKWALTHAICRKAEDGVDVSPFSKDERKLIWKQFFKQFGRVIYVTRKVKVYE